MSYYKDEFDKRGFDTMWFCFQIGQHKLNIPQLKQAIQNLIKMMSQKSSGRKGSDINL